MPRYTAEMHGSFKLEAQQRLADGRWTPIARVKELDTDAGYAVVVEADENGQTMAGPGGQLMERRVQGDFRMVHSDTGEVNPAFAGPTAVAAPMPRAVDVVGMVDSLHQTAKQLPDGNWSSSYSELPEVLAVGATEVEARAAARAQALELGELVAKPG